MNHSSIGASTFCLLGKVESSIPYQHDDLTMNLSLFQEMSFCCASLLQVRSVACSTLQRAAVAGESLEVLAASLAKGLGERVLPAIEALSKKVRSRDMPQVGVGAK